ncbi:MAG: hypothetical protein J6S67_05825 [Methanobrevibacter sp.]|nr:hypothetical protein [Methanobrevibacter sp.]
MVVLPAVITFFGLVGTTLEWSFTEPVVIIATGFDTMLGTILGISNIQYKSMVEYDDAGEDEDYD